MKKEQKNQEIEALKEEFSKVPNFYFADTTSMTVEQVNKFRRICFEKGVVVRMAKNSLITKALEANNINVDDFGKSLKGQTVLLFSETANEPAKLIKQFRKDGERPSLKAAYIDSAIFIGDNQLEALASLKSKSELIGEIIGLLQSPAKNVIGALQSGGQKLSGIVKTLSERPE
jgi:large subunit ribosomal protein L10